jgi:hypothetical protein
VRLSDARAHRDMHDNIALDARIQGSFGWQQPVTPARTPERRVFEHACAKWDEYVCGLPPSAPERRRERERTANQRLSRTIRVFCAWK